MATQIGSGMLINPQALRTSEATSSAKLGTIAETNDGRRVRYVQNGATTMVSGRLMQAALEITAHQNLAPAVAAIGDTTVNVKLGATAVNANEYTDGWIITTANAGEAEMYAISGHAAVDASGTIVLALSDPIEVAWTADTTVDLVKNPYKAVIINPAPPTSAVVGVALHAIAASEFGWVGVAGPHPVFAGPASLTVGFGAIANTATAGEVLTTELGVEQRNAEIGITLTGVATSEFGVMMYNIN